MAFKDLYRASPPELKQIIIDQWKIKQNPTYHPEGNTLKHIIVVTNRAFKNFPDNKNIQLAAYFHDLGKLATYDINPKTGQPTAYGHEIESVNLINKFSNFIEQQGANPKIVEYIVKNHMKIKPSTWDVIKPSKKNPIINDPNYQDLEKFGTIDKGGLIESQYLLQNEKQMKKQILSEEFKRMQKLAGIITEAVEVPTWLKGKLEDVHTKPGQGSIFAKSINDVLKLTQDALDKSKDIDKIANSTGTLTVKSPGIGYNLVLPIEQAKKLPGAKESEVEKIEGPNKVKVPAITTTAPLTQFKSDELTIIVRPKKDESGTVIPNEYIVLSAFPGDPSIPRASEWNGKYAVIIPSGKEELKEVEHNIDEIINKVLKKHRRILKENEDKKEKINDFFYSDEIKQDTGVTSFTTCDEDDWDKVKNYIGGKGINGVTGKQVFLNKNEDITEEEFDKYYDEWLDYIEDERADESRNQQDYNY